VTSTVVTTTKSTERSVTLAEQVRSGNVRAVSRLITLLESQDPDGIEGLRLLASDKRPRIVIGVTGYPGAGKSTLINALLCAYRRQESKVAVLAVDVSSAMTGRLSSLASAFSDREMLEISCSRLSVAWPRMSWR